MTTAVGTSLSKLSQEFSVWREKSKRRGRIPNVLKQQALVLLERYSEQELLLHLSIQPNRVNVSQPSRRSSRSRYFFSELQGVLVGPRQPVGGILTYLFSISL